MRTRIKGKIIRRHLNGKGNEKYINKFDAQEFKGNRNSDIQLHVLVICTSEELCEKI